MALWQGAAREHPLYRAVTESQRRRKAILAQPSGRTQLSPAGDVARQSQIHLGYAPSSRLARSAEICSRKGKVISGKGH